MDIKPRPNHRRYLDILRRMTPAQRLQISFELTEFSRQLFKDGLRRGHPEMGEAQLHQLYLDRLNRCHNKNY